MPAAQGVHLVPPPLTPVSVMEPSPQSRQASAVLLPATVTYLPARQSVHAATFDCSEYLPATHAVQLVAPASMPVLVMEPAAHAMQASTLDCVEYMPAAHCVHVLAPGLVSVSVIEPAGQRLHSNTLEDSEYRPGYTPFDIAQFAGEEGVSELLKPP